MHVDAASGHQLFPVIELVSTASQPMTEYMPRTILPLANLIFLVAATAYGQDPTIPNTGVVAASFTDAATEPTATARVEFTKQDIEKEQAALQSAGLSETQKPECEATAYQGSRMVANCRRRTQPLRGS